MQSLIFHNVEKQFGTVSALDGFSMEIAPGQLTVLLGASGSGKTTALRLAAGLEQPDGGYVSLGAQNLNGLSPLQRGCALVFQNYSLYPHMTAAENIAYPLRMRGVDSAERNRRIAWASELLHLTPDEMARQPHALSGGQRQRIALGKALAIQPDVLLLDEPFSSLDHNLRLTLRGELRRIQRDLGIAVLMVTHDQTDAAAIGDKVAVMHQGRIRQIGTPSEIYETPADRFVAGFVGNPPMRFIPVESDGETIRFANGRAVSFAFDSSCTGPLVLGFRPDDVSLVDAGNGIGSADVVGVERIAQGSLVYADFCGERLAISMADDTPIPSNPEIALKQVSMIFDKDGHVLHQVAQAMCV